MHQCLYCKHVLPLGGMVNCTTASGSPALTLRSLQTGSMPRAVFLTIVTMCFCMLICRTATDSDMQTAFAVALSKIFGQGLYGKHALNEDLRCLPMHSQPFDVSTQSRTMPMCRDGCFSAAPHACEPCIVQEGNTVTSMEKVPLSKPHDLPDICSAQLRHRSTSWNLESRAKDCSADSRLAT
jgi:hypothetical protein